MVNQSSYFSIKTFYNNVLVDSNDNFGFIIFNQATAGLTDTSTELTSGQPSTVISEITNWSFKFKPTTYIPKNSTIRITFQDEFVAVSPICNLKDNFGQCPNSVILHNYRIVECRNIAKDMKIGEANQLDITNIQNPGYKTVAANFTLEILSPDRSSVLAEAFMQPNIPVKEAPLIVELYPENQYKQSKVYYTFYFRLNQTLNNQTQIFINFNQTLSNKTWNIYNKTCAIVRGLIGEKQRCYLDYSNQ